MPAAEMRRSDEAAAPPVQPPNRLAVNPQVLETRYNTASTVKRGKRACHRRHGRRQVSHPLLLWATMAAAAAPPGLRKARPAHEHGLISRAGAAARRLGAGARPPAVAGGGCRVELPLAGAVRAVANCRLATRSHGRGAPALGEPHTRLLARQRRATATHSSPLSRPGAAALDAARARAHARGPREASKLLQSCSRRCMPPFNRHQAALTPHQKARRPQI